MARPRIYDALVSVAREAAAIATFRLLNEGQSMTPAEHVTGAAAHLVLIAEHHKVPVQDVFTVVKNLMNNHDDRLGTEFEAIRMYLKEENR